MVVAVVSIIVILAVVAVMVAIFFFSRPVNPNPSVNALDIQKNIIFDKAMRQIMVNPDQAQLYVSNAYDEIDTLQKQIQTRGK